MKRSIGYAAAGALLYLFTFTARAEVVTTTCSESEISLDATHSAARLGDCSSEQPDLLWHLDRIDQVGGALDGRFDRRSTGAGAVVYVMDTGVMATHSEFRAAGGTRVIAGYDTTSAVTIGRSICTSPDKSTAPCYADFDELAAASHGTAVASIVAGRRIGVAPGASIVSIRVMNERGLATTRTYLDGLDAIIRHASVMPFETAVVNISAWVLERLSSASSDPTPAVPFADVEKKMRDMIAGTYGKRFLFVVAANNIDGGCGRSGNIDRFPAILGKSIDGMITVGGMTPSNEAWMGTCSGGVEVLAPAQSIFSASITAIDHYRGRRPNLRSGTSFAAPVISGIAARLLSERPDLTPEQIEAWITATPSRVENPDIRLASGKVAYVRSIAAEAAQSIAQSARAGQ
jgi:subtilisin family serine protease